MKKNLLVVALFASGFLPAASYAAPTGTIKFTGKVGVSSCVLQLGSTNVNVPLPPVDSSTLKNANDVIGLTGFQVNVDSCPKDTKISISFSPDSNTDSNGNLINTSTNVDKTNAQVQLLDSNRQAINLMNDNGVVARQVVADGTGPVTLQYYAQYFAKTSNTTSGDLEASIQFLMSYE